MFQRNRGLLTEEEQKKLANLRVGIAGAGMGSQIGLALTRLGVRNFLLVDADVVEVHNFNRQAYRWKQIGLNKAEALAVILREINPEVRLRTWSYEITPDNALSFVEGIDVVVDCIDPNPKGLKASIALSRVCQKQKKYFYPLDLGWGARLYVFSSTGMGLEEFLGVGPDELKEREGVPFDILGRAFTFIPDYLGPVFEAMARGELEYYPQVITSTLAVAILVVVAVAKIVRGESLRLVPEYYSFDPMGAV
ncbi:MAG: hypothetical protein COS47_01105 [Candidatus Nealsonbacteria bacterium CG03_land_8_20_14_0_80_36_12]|uniref:THIF-type NAD/FAD binding fold domain-containing protein n=1 Tax=Candidatus Nealsonbacteria bacterium CG03_land_8_20_14_0_80_36_12 TaxID=1974701 RepID=A0A2M7BYI3_9BACT|nr:MAG: hypothetical protein COS47_01105 [Candidatus Nealsonbacteria bacterium CG03_land_8_20_14_0_80_36_12]